jgi:hypothetical protein
LIAIIEFYTVYIRLSKTWLGKLNKRVMVNWEDARRGKSKEDHTPQGSSLDSGVNRALNNVVCN